MRALATNLRPSHWVRPTFSGVASVRRAVDWLLALDVACRELDTMRSLDDHMLRDIGITRSDLDAALSKPGEQLRLILARGGDQLER